VTTSATVATARRHPSVLASAAFPEGQDSAPPYQSRSNRILERRLLLSLPVFPFLTVRRTAERNLSGCIKRQPEAIPRGDSGGLRLVCHSFDKQKKAKHIHQPVELPPLKASLSPVPLRKCPPLVLLKCLLYSQNRLQPVNNSGYRCGHGTASNLRLST